MARAPLVSIVIDNFNYGRFLAEAIDSALAQSWPHIEVIVVDDGSTDQSRAVIAGYGDCIRALLKENGGQGSAYNAGWAAANGDIVWFLDADDRLLPDAAAQVVPLFADPGLAQVHAPLWMIDADGRRLGRRLPGDPLAGGDQRGQLLRWGPVSRAVAPGSGNVWARWFLDLVMPMPQTPYRICADAYPLLLAPLLGRLAVAEPFGEYRVHGANAHLNSQHSVRHLRRDVEIMEQDARTLAYWAEHLGYPVDPQSWLRSNWRHQLRRHLLARHGELADGPPIAQVIAALVADQTRWRYKLPLAAAFVALLSLPPKLALAPLCRLLARHLEGGAAA